ncbi:MAG: ParB/RepB/Spo0J family partition protein [Deltaproteobacteria bacterium]|nr:ParB/RepB/Spo0J family partition protein [Deltaproteobacteria bacterium]
MEEKSLPCQSLEDHPLRLNFYDQAHLAELVASIKATGLLEPLLVQPVDRGYQVLSGHYRLRAVRQLKWIEVPCRVYPCDEHTAKLIYCTANLTTRTLSALEEAWLLRDLVKNEGFSMARAGALFGRSKSWACRRLKLLSALDPRVKEEVALGRLKPRLAQELTRLPRGNEQVKALEIIKEHHLNKEEVARLVSHWPEPGGPPAWISCGRSPSFVVARHLWRCTRLMEEVLNILRRQKRPFDWWPAEPYRFFLGSLNKLFNFLTTGGESSAPHFPGTVKQKGL